MHSNNSNPPNVALHRASTHASTTTTSSRIAPSMQTRRSTDSRMLEQVLHPGDEIGPGLSILGQPISIVNARSDNVPVLRVVRKLATGSYAVVYLVQEVASYTGNFLDIDEDSPPGTPGLEGRYFALKCLAKSAQDQQAQLVEATIHQSLPVHENVVTLWTTLETSSYFLFVLDYIPGEDLFYFLEQNRDLEQDNAPADGSAAPSVLDPVNLLSFRRLRLIASMFSQMCDAVAHCHRNGVFHRDIKPENFMVTDSRVFNPKTGQHDRKVSVKLTDFGLATRDIESGDMECGSAPYMSFECHNNLMPAYATGPADVWSLGIVLINMIYHANPWATTALGHCESFDYFLREPIAFFMQGFPGITPAVADFFARRVFCLLDTPSDPIGGNRYTTNYGRRITADEFGRWSRDLHLHLGPSARRTPAIAFQRFSDETPPSPPPVANRLMIPSVSQPGTRTPSPSFQSAPPLPLRASSPTDGIDIDSDEEDGYRSRTTSSKRRKRAPRGKSQLVAPSSSSTAITGEISSAAQYAASVVAAKASNEQRLADLAEKSQLVAREASQIISQKTPPAMITSLEPNSVSDVTVNIIPATPAMNPVRSTPELRKKKSNKWTDIFKRDSASDQEVPTAAEISAMEKQKEERLLCASPVSLSSSPISTSKPTSTARNVTNLIMGLSSKTSLAHPDSHMGTSIDLDEEVSWTGNGHARSSSVSSRGRRKDRKGLDRESLVSVSTSSTSNSWARGQSAPSGDRRARSRSPTADAALAHFNILVPSAPSAPARLPPVPAVPETYRSSVPVPVLVVGQQDVGAQATSATTQPSRRSYAPSIASVSTTTTSSSAFTAFSGKKGWRNSGSSRYSQSNASLRSVSTAATSVSSGSWKSTANGKKGGPPPLPATNIKVMDGVPWELDEMPRQMSHRPKDHTFAPAPTKKNRRAPSAPSSPAPGASFGLDPISEKPKKSSMKPSRTPVPALPNGNDGMLPGDNGIDSIDAFDPSGMPTGRGKAGLRIDAEAANASAVLASGYGTQSSEAATLDP
ncbi:hypothetical protein FRC17_008130 [Serendipita sp. 399]|nr:hypothetical protein FRC17_008130 [Serendipita sp. 399]